MINRSIILAILLCLPWWLAAQNKLLKKADKLYKVARYAEAIPLYEEVLKTKENNSTKTKLADCYRILNQASKAEPLYADIITFEHTKPINFYNYATTLMNLGKYSAANQWFTHYLSIVPNDEKALQMQAACDQIDDIKPLFAKVKIDSFAYNSDADDNAPVFFQEKLIFCSDRNRGTALFKEHAGATGREFLYLYECQRNNSGGFTPPNLFTNKINYINKNVGPATFSADGNTIIFARNSDISSKTNTYNIQLYESSLDGDKWRDVRLLPFCSKEFNYMHPALSPDNKTLYFVSNKGGSKQGTDIFVSERKNDGGWTQPIPVGDAINTPANEGFPFLDAQGRLYFCSKGHIGFGGFDIFRVEKNEDGTWQKPRNLGTPFNSPSDDISFYINADEREGAFSSSRDGGDDDIYLFDILGGAEQSFRPASQERSQFALEKDSNPSNNSSSVLIVSNADFMPNDAKNEHIAPPFLLPDSDDLKTGTRHLLYFLFDSNSSFINKQVQAQLNELLVFLKTNTALAVELNGHTDSRGDDETNMQLSSERVNAVMNYLIENGIAKERLVGDGLGENYLLNHCKNGVFCDEKLHAVNQRIEMKIISQ